MRLVLSTGEVVLCFCAAAVALYASPFFVERVNANASNAWEFLPIWDDRENFLDNEVIQSGLGLADLYAMFTMTKINVYEPFGWLLKAVQVQLAGLDSWLVRVVSMTLHFLAAAVLARTSALLLDVLTSLSDLKAGIARGEEMQRHNDRSHWYGCCLSAVAFAIHPVHVEVIGWPSAQPYTLCALFSNLALYVYVRTVHRELRGVSIGDKNTKAWLMASIFNGHGWPDLLCCALYLSALLSKSACILLPAGFFLVDVLVYTSLQPQLPLPSGRQCFSYVTGKSPVAATLLTFLAVMLGSNYYGMHRDTDVLTLTLGERVIKAAAMPAWVLRRILWPTKLRPHYQLRPGELRLTNPEYLLSLSASAMAASFALWLFLHRRAPQHLLALAYFAIMVLPVSGLIQHGMVSVGCDRYAYLCSVVAVPYGGAVLARLLFAGDQDDGKVVGHEDKPHAARLDHRRAVSVGGALLTGALLFISTNLAGVWRNEDALYEYSLRMDPADWRVMDQRAEHFINTGRYTVKDEAFRHLLELAYHFTPMGTLKAELLHLKLLLWLDEMDPACDGYMQLLELHPESCHVHNNAAVCLLQRGEVDQARLEFERALRSPGYEDVHNYPRGNLKALDDWLALKEAAEARGEEATVPNMETKVMF